jgi:hypothetical protein
MVACLVLPSSHQTPAAWEAGGLLSGEPCGYPGVSLHLPLRRACCSPATALVTTGPDPHSERQLRAIVAVPEWGKQRKAWERLEWVPDCSTRAGSVTVEQSSDDHPEHKASGRGSRRGN